MEHSYLHSFSISRMRREGRRNHDNREDGFDNKKEPATKNQVTIEQMKLSKKKKTY